MKILLSSIFVILVFSISYGQIRLRPHVILKAEALKKEFPKEKYVSLSNYVEYNYIEDNNQVKCRKFVKEKIMSLSENLTFYKNVMFNEESYIEKVKVSNYRGAKNRVRLSKNKYKSDGIFYDDASVASFKFLLSTRGDNSEYSYFKVFKDAKYATKEFFHNYYPIEVSTIVFNIPDWLKIDFVECNFEGYQISKIETYNAKKKINRIEYSLKKLKSIVGGSYSISISQELPHLLILYRTITIDGKTTDLVNTTQDLYDWYSGLLKTMENNPSVFSAKVGELTSSATTDKEKVANIFYWVQDNTRYIAYEDGIMGFKPANADDVYTNRYGDCKGMANLTCSMLKEAGFDARLTWIGTKSIPYTYNTPSLAVDNHMITTLYLDGEKYFLDATEKGVAMGEYAYRIQGQDVLIEDGDNYILDTVPEFGDDYNLRKTVYILKLEGDVLSGEAHEEFHGEERVRLYSGLGNISKADLFDRVNNYVANYDKNNSISNLHISNYIDRTKPINFEYDISIKNVITELENERYLNLDLDKKYSSLVTEKNRNLGFDFLQKVHNNYEASLIIPANYTVDYLPDSINIDNDEFMIKVNYNYDQANSIIKYSKTIIIKNGVVSPSYFEEWNKAIKKLKEVYNDQMVLIIK